MQTVLEPWLLFLADDPMLRMVQFLMLAVGSLAIFLVFFATRDILLRTDSFLIMFLCILLVALLPGVGFLLYLLLRPPRTLKERELEALIQQLLSAQQGKGSVSKRKLPRTSLAEGDA